MSVTLFHCPACDKYSKWGARVTRTVRATLRATLGDLMLDDEGDEYPSGGVIPLTDIVESRCSECEGPTELVTLDECPHFWSMCLGGPLERQCIYCGERQEGRLVFDE